MTQEGLPAISEEEMTVPFYVNGAEARSMYIEEAHAIRMTRLPPYASVLEDRLLEDADTPKATSTYWNIQGQTDYEKSVGHYQNSYDQNKTRRRGRERINGPDQSLKAQFQKELSRIMKKELQDVFNVIKQENMANIGRAE